MDTPSPAGARQPSAPSAPSGAQLIERSSSCEGDTQHYGPQTATKPQPQHTRAYQQNHLPVAQNINLQWKSSEDIFMSSSGSTILSQPINEEDGEPVCYTKSGSSHRLVTSVSAYPLSNTNTVSTGISNSTSAAASTSTISSTSSSSSASTNAFSHMNSLQSPPTSSQTPAGCHTNANANLPYAVSNSSEMPVSNIISTSTPIGDVNNAQCNSIGGITPLDLSTIPPITHVTLPTPTENGEGRFSHSPTPSPKPSPTLLPRQPSCDSSDDRTNRNENSGYISREGSMERSYVDTSIDHQPLDKTVPHDSVSRSSESSRSVEAPRTPEISHSINGLAVKERKESRDSKSSDKKSNKAWYKMLNPTYKSRSEDLKRLFKDLPSDERLIVDYSCALQKDILVHGRLYVTPNYFSFYSKIFGWETFVSIRCKDIIAMTKEKTALVIPNAIEIRTEGEKHFLTSFASRDKTYLMLFRIWQNALMDQQMSATELWQWVHSSYGDELGLTSDDDDYVAPSTEDDAKTNTSNMHSDRACDSSSINTNLKLYTGDSMEDACPADQSLEESQVPPVPKGGESETSEQVSSHKPQPPKSSSPTKSPHHSTHNSSPQPNDGIPTDMSDTTETEPDSKVTCLSSECVVCPNLTTHHQGREIINTVFALPVDTVFTLLFTNSKFMLDLYTARKTTDVVASPWQSNHETNQKLRQVTYTLTLPPNSFGPKVSHVTETQVLSPFSKPGEIYTVDAEACNAGIPYADSFFVSNHWCLTRESATETRLSVWSQVKYKKNVWGFMKGVIDKNSFCGVESLLNDINAALLAEVDSANLKRTRRRRRRVGSKGEPPDVLIPSTADKVKDIHKSTQIPARKLTLPTVTTENNNSSNEGPVRLVVATLVILLTLNALLYYKLWALEEKMFVHTTPFPALDPSMFRPGTGSGALEEWVRILQQQEALHAAEVERWRKSIEEAAGFLRKAEESLRTLHTSIPPHHASKIQLLLRQLQNLHNSESQRRSSAESVQWGQEGSPGDPSKGPDVGDQANSGEERTVHVSENHQDL
ncbi:protein Aster-B [Penaeus vannamei]|uniref:GRAM domain-containing protein 1B n=1 Tax=Penaeus vannamei TaxID=6689 RepID=A0A3R7PJW3_PENVA|nr:GRAM domain-containing protein 1B-like isoform X1 [Penaeus vannamei]ROT68943.1 GRAM domain-containing protein 1B [Penaeus vannamei]